MNHAHSHACGHPNHDHGHARADHAHRRGRKLLVAFALTASMMVAEVGGGLWSGSLALLADAGHMLVDALALLLALLAARMALRPADARRTYGYGRMEVLAGFVNALTQFVLVGFIAYEAIERLFKPVAILSGVMLGVALVGLVVNVIVLRSLHGHAHDDVNLGAASLHVLGDLMGSVGAVLAALAVRAMGWNWADPVLSLLVSLLILHSAWQLLRRSTHILLEGVPEGMDTREVESVLRGADASIRDVHHLHVWQLASGSRMATLHLELHDAGDGARVLAAVNRTLLERFGIRHATVQIDPGDCPDEDPGCGAKHRH
ncbi:MAG TPA: cation diffusion facilitator family transporter [Dyella sp.]|uniref:cation diffusion facilitator family transporter n=1 Tax=Dyella sp. TaxID=1869338 RepID=UPI002BEEFAB0|nr:cation diffusion facilitator family transporter [Dyella sp.]HTV84304.1 cation diffusion facilitator family transporter [Dyella sp.]